MLGTQVRLDNKKTRAKKIYKRSRKIPWRVGISWENRPEIIYARRGLRAGMLEMDLNSVLNYTGV